MLLSGLYARQNLSGVEVVTYVFSFLCIRVVSSHFLLCGFGSYSLPNYVICSYLAAQSCNHGDLRLIGGPVNSEGRVEICISGLWGRVCHNSWDSRDARVVCRHLGFPVDVSGSGKSHFKLKFCILPMFPLPLLKCLMYVLN